MLPSLDDYLHPKKLRYELTLSKNIHDQRILQSYWTRQNLPQPTKTSSLKS